MAFNKIGILVAMDSEFALMKNLLVDIRETDFHKKAVVGRVGGKLVGLMKTGIGKVNAAISAIELIDGFAPDCIINTGVAGGIDRSVDVADIVVGATTCYHDFYAGEVADHLLELGFPDEIPANKQLLDSLRSQSQVNPSVKIGQICTGDQFITNNDALEVIKNKRPAGLAVDMESNSVAHVCFMRKVPFVSFRVISDTPWVDNQAQQYADFWTSAPQKTFNLLSDLIEQI
ncbi:MAG: 5'-methylthioadenosine/S-adenosylhomocysteine nucleosidase [Paludibacteraceae bacterium]|nr:5'-methylthioadenosine/S-adenosylhomocysteine nucleosidase [Paludibacteraceae bacterium]